MTQMTGTDTGVCEVDVNITASVAQGCNTPTAHSQSIVAFANSLFDDTLALPSASKPRARASQALETRIVKHFKAADAAAGGACALLAALFDAPVAPDELADEFELKKRWPELDLPIGIIIREYRRALAAARVAVSAAPAAAIPEVCLATASSRTFSPALGKQAAALVVGPTKPLLAAASQDADVGLRISGVESASDLVPAPMLAPSPNPSRAPPSPPTLPALASAGPSVATALRHPAEVVQQAHWQAGGLFAIAAPSAALPQRRRVDLPRTPAELEQLFALRDQKVAVAPAPISDAVCILPQRLPEKAPLVAAPEVPTRGQPMGFLHGLYPLEAAHWLGQTQEGGANPSTTISEPKA